MHIHLSFQVISCRRKVRQSLVNETEIKIDKQAILRYSSAVYHYNAMGCSAQLRCENNSTALALDNVLLIDCTSYRYGLFVDGDAASP